MWDEDAKLLSALKQPTWVPNLDYLTGKTGKDPKRRGRNLLQQKFDGDDHRHTQGHSSVPQRLGMQRIHELTIATSDPNMGLDTSQGSVKLNQADITLNTVKPLKPHDHVSEYGKEV